MKRIISVVFVSFIFLSACKLSVTVDEESEANPAIEDGEQVEENTEEVEALQLQMSQVDRDAGVTIEENETYQFLDEFVKENPKLGTVNEFSIHSITLVTDVEGNQQMLFLGVNRLGEPIKNVSFELSLGSTEGEMVWEELPVVLGEEDAGEFKNNAALPIFLPVTSEGQIEVMNTISQENLYVEFENFSFESVEG